MKNKKKVSLFLVVVFSLSLGIFAGCGNGDQPGEERNSLERVLDAGELTVVGSGGYPPFNFYEGDDVVGFDVDTGAAIAERLGVELNYVTSDWDGLIEGLRAGRYDGILGSMAITPDRQEVVNFTVPYYFSGAQLVVREDSGITDTDQMDGLLIGVATGTTFADDAEELGAEVRYYQDDNQTLMELLNGRIDGVITDRLVAIGGMGQIAGGDELMLAGDLLRTEEMGIAVNKDDVELLEELNRILDELHADGTLTSISERWHDGEDITAE